MATHENLLATVEALGARWLEQPGVWDPRHYQNRREVWGLYVGFWHAYQHHMISVHNCSRVLTPSELAYLVEGIEFIDEFRFGGYATKKEVLGFYATAQSTRELDGSKNHWFMIARSPERNFSQIARSAERSFSRILRAKSLLSEEEQDVLTYLETAANKSGSSPQYSPRRGPAFPGIQRV